MKPSPKVVLGLLVILVDIAVYIILGLLLMNYDDFYEESKGAYWSVESMDRTERWTVYGLQFWNVINVLVLLLIIYRVIKRFGKKSAQQQPV